MQFDKLVKQILEAKEAPKGKHYNSAGELRKGDADADGRGGPKYRSDPTYNNPNDPEDEEKQKGVDGKACWKGYRRVGTKKKGSKTVDNCVKVEDEESYDEDAEKVDKDRMKCNSPRRTSGGSKKFVVKACKDGKEKIVRYGDPNMKIKKSNPKRRKSFRARHKCDQKKDKFSAGYWSCKKW